MIATCKSIFPLLNDDAIPRLYIFTLPSEEDDSKNGRDNDDSDTH